ncbi:MAG: hypothetical protein SOZ59_06885 [Candidatus Limivivens sp.]|nr:hypothetical protein [Candidatus Limivivens sp.]
MKKGRKTKLLGILALTFLLTMLCQMTTMAATKTQTLTSGKWVKNTTQKYGDVYYYKIVVPKTGYLAVEGYGFSNYSDSRYSLSVKLCDSKKKELETYRTSLTSSHSCKSYYGVKKGTYYLKVEDSNYRLRYSFKAVTEKSGTAQKKAVSVPKNKTVGGLAIAGEKGTKIDYYKITLTKAQKITFTFGAKANSWIQFKIVPANTKQIIFGSSVYRWDTTETVVTKDKFPKGTYYIQVYRMSNDADTSGYYTLKWK